MNSDIRSNLEQPGPSRKLVFIVDYDAALDCELAEYLKSRFESQGHEVHFDGNQETGEEWAKGLSDAVLKSDAVLPMVSARAIESEMFTYLVEMAHETAQKHQGKPHILPIRFGLEGELPEPLNGIIDPLKQFRWAEKEDRESLCKDVLGELAQLPEPKARVRVEIRKGLRLAPRLSRSNAPVRVSVQASHPADAIPKELEPVGGAVPLHSDFYMKRQADQDLNQALNRQDSIILIKGARQIGKTSLLARGMQHARERGAKSAMTDLQKFNASNLGDITVFFISLAESLADQLGLDVLPTDVWDERRGPSVNFERFIRKEVLHGLNRPLVWGLDEVDRLFSCSFGSEVFGLFRSWHNERALDPNGPWAGLSLVISYATEAHLFITDMNQSPFNVGTRLVLDDFTREQVSELNKRYRQPLKSDEEMTRYMAVVGGHPFLVRRGMHEMTTQKMPLNEFITGVSSDDGIFGDHLRRILVLLAKDPHLTEVVKRVLSNKGCPDAESFYRLRSAGIMKGNSQSDIRPRCELYAKFLCRHLLDSDQASNFGDL